MDKLAAMKAFVTVVAEEGFAAAARELGQSRSAVNRLVLQLEDHLGAQLLNRTTRAVSPTAAGIAYHEKALTVLAAVEDADRTIAEKADAPSGILRVNAPMTFEPIELGPCFE